MEKAILLLGSNIGNRLEYLRNTINFLKQERVLILNMSSVYESPSFGYESVSPYYNLALEVQSKHSPKNLLTICQTIENKLKRVRSTTERYSDRTIDIDIILIESHVIDIINLIVPHPRMHERVFCLKPVNDIASDWIIPTLNKTVKGVLSNFKETNEVKKLNVEV